VLVVFAETQSNIVGSEIFIVRWRNGSFSFLFGQSQETLFLALDEIGPPSDARVRIVPPDLMCEVTFDQESDLGYFRVNVAVEEMLWRKCEKQIWPLESLLS